jgi:hypothetical protein
MRKAYALLKAAESKLLSQVKTPAAGMGDCDKPSVRLRAVARIPKLVAVQEQTRRKQPKLSSLH